MFKSTCTLGTLLLRNGRHDYQHFVIATVIKRATKTGQITLEQAKTMLNLS